MTRAAFALLAFLAACSEPETATAPQPQPAPPVVVCNDIAPDPTKAVTVGEATSEEEFRGGAIKPGVYDLVSAARVGAARGWQGGSAVALGVAPDAAGYVLNWSAITPDGQRDTWTATLSGGSLRYMCGRIGEVAASYRATAASIGLQIADGADGSLSITFARRP